MNKEAHLPGPSKLIVNHAGHHQGLDGLVAIPLHVAERHDSSADTHRKLLFDIWSNPGCTMGAVKCGAGAEFKETCREKEVDKKRGDAGRHHQWTRRV